MYVFSEIYFLTNLKSGYHVRFLDNVHYLAPSVRYYADCIGMVRREGLGRLFSVIPYPSQKTTHYFIIKAVVIYPFVR